MFSGFGGSILYIKTYKPMKQFMAHMKISFIHLYKLGFLLYQVIILSGKYHLSPPVTIPAQAFAGHIAAMVYMTSKPSVSDK